MTYDTYSTYHVLRTPTYAHTPTHTHIYAYVSGMRANLRLTHIVLIMYDAHPHTHTHTHIYAYVSGMRANIRLTQDHSACRKKDQITHT